MTTQRSIVQSIGLYAILGIGIGFLFFVSWGIRNVIVTTMGDELRAIAVLALYALAGILEITLIKEGIKQAADRFTLAAAGAFCFHLLIGGAFIFVDMAMNRFSTFNDVEQRLRIGISVATWTSATITGLIIFSLMNLRKRHFGTSYKLGYGMLILDAAVSILALLCSAWSTFDLFYNLTHDYVYAVAMATLVDIVLGVAAYYVLIANDKYTASLAKSIVVVAAFLAIGNQIGDGIVKGTNFQTTEQIRFLVQFFVPIAGVFGLGSLIALYFVDTKYGGSSFVKQKETPIPVIDTKPTTAPVTQSIPVQMPQTTQTTEPVGIPVLIPTSMRAKLVGLGYSEIEIDRMRPSQALHLLKEWEAATVLNGATPPNS